MIDTFDAFEPWHWRRLLRVPWTARRSNQSILKEISPDYLLEGLMLKLKVQSFGDVMRRTNSLERPWCWERLKAGGQGDNRGWDGWIWHHQRDGHEFEQALGVDNGQGSLVCCSPWGRKELDTTEWLNWTQAYTLSDGQKMNIHRSFYVLGEKKAQNLIRSYRI